MKIRLIATVSLLSLSLGGCTMFESPKPEPTPVKNEVPAINPNYKTGSANVKNKPAPGFNEVVSKASGKPVKVSAKNQEDKLRLPAMKEAAISYGAKAGLAYGTQKVNQQLESRAASLTKSYNFEKLMIQGPNGVMAHPPIIVEAQDSWETSDGGKTVRLADTVYEIIEQTKFTSTAPMWQNYLISHFDEASIPPAPLMPRDSAEKSMWDGWVAEGWKQGEAQAQEIFQANLDLLNRDFTGMVRYKKLLEEGKVSPTRIAEADLGNTGTGQDMRVNDKAIRITEDPSLQINPRGWSASVTAKDGAGNHVGSTPVNDIGKQPRVNKGPKTAPKAPRKTEKAPETAKVDKALMERGNRF